MNSTLQPISLPQPQVSLSPLHFAQNSPDFRPLFSIASALRIRQRMRILSDHRESKDSSPVPPFARSLHKERFRTLLGNKRFRTLSFSVSCNPFVCHSYENCRVCTNNSHSGTPRAALTTLTSNLQALTSVFSSSCRLFPRLLTQQPRTTPFKSNRFTLFAVTTGVDTESVWVLSFRML